MTDLFETLERWRAEGRRIALATLVAVERSAPRGPGAAMAVCDRGEVAGSVSGGCVEGALYEEAQDVLRTGRPRMVTYGISDETAIGVGLTCGGTLHVFVELLDGPSGRSAAIDDRLAALWRAERPAALVTRLDGEGCGATLLVTADDAEGELGTRGLTFAATAEARAMLRAGTTGIRSFGRDGEPIGVEARLFVHVFAPRPVMYVFGAIDFSRATATIGRFLGYRVVVVDARPVFATKERVPDADDVVVAWPDTFLANAPVDERTAIVVLTHDAKFDVPLLEVALRTPARYIGVMGSRRTHAARLEELHTRGITAADLARIFAPVGLDLGARTPEETAVAIAAELLAVASGASGGHLRDTDRPIHATPVTAP